ncbi:hypothetical protein Tco_1301340 [Tanacetum coccineum]
MYLVFSHMLKSFDREDLETLWNLVKAKHGSTRPEEGYERVLWGDLKTMFDPHVEDQVWRNQQDYKVLDLKLYDSCGVHLLRKQNVHIHMLVEKRYPLTAPTITYMLNRKLQGRIVGIKRLLEVTAAKVCVTAAKLKHILKAKAKPFPPCTHSGFNDHRPNDYRNYLECKICGSYDHFTLGYNRVIHIRGGMLAESS